MPTRDPYRNQFFRLKVGERETLECGDFDWWEIVRTGKREYWILYGYVVAERPLAPDEGGGGHMAFGPFKSSSEALEWWRRIPVEYGRKNPERAPPLPRPGVPPWGLLLGR